MQELATLVMRLDIATDVLDKIISIMKVTNLHFWDVFAEVEDNESRRKFNEIANAVDLCIDQMEKIADDYSDIREMLNKAHMAIREVIASE